MAKCKRATANELIESLKSVDLKHPLLEKGHSCVYHLTEKIDGEDLILKVIQPGKERSEKRIPGEVRALYHVGQLRGWGYTPDRKFYYLFIKNMGIPLQALLETTFGDNAERARDLRVEAEKFYLSNYHIKHG